MDQQIEQLEATVVRIRQAERRMEETTPGDAVVERLRSIKGIATALASGP